MPWMHDACSHRTSDSNRLRPIPQLQMTTTSLWQGNSNSSNNNRYHHHRQSSPQYSAGTYSQPVLQPRPIDLNDDHGPYNELPGTFADPYAAAPLAHVAENQFQSSAARIAALMNSSTSRPSPVLQTQHSVSMTASMHPFADTNSNSLEDDDFQRRYGPSGSVGGDIFASYASLRPSSRQLEMLRQEQEEERRQRERQEKERQEHERQERERVAVEQRQQQQQKHSEQKKDNDNGDDPFDLGALLAEIGMGSDSRSAHSAQPVIFGGLNGSSIQNQSHPVPQPQPHSYQQQAHSGVSPQSFQHRQPQYMPQQPLYQHHHQQPQQPPPAFNPDFSGASQLGVRPSPSPLNLPQPGAGPAPTPGHFLPQVNPSQQPQQQQSSMSGHNFAAPAASSGGIGIGMYPQQQSWISAPQGPQIHPPLMVVGVGNSSSMPQQQPSYPQAQQAPAHRQHHHLQAAYPQPGGNRSSVPSLPAAAAPNPSPYGNINPSWYPAPSSQR